MKPWRVKRPHRWRQKWQVASPGVAGAAGEVVSSQLGAASDLVGSWESSEGKRLLTATIAAALEPSE